MLDPLFYAVQQMKAKLIKGNLLRVTLYKHNKPGSSFSLKKFPPFCLITELVKSLKETVDLLG